MGIKEALSWIKNQNTQPVIVETDCLSVIQAIRCSSVHLSYFGRVIDECKSLVNELKNCRVTLNFVKQYANTVAHFLARHNSSVADRIWSGNVFTQNSIMYSTEQRFDILMNFSLAKKKILISIYKNVSAVDSSLLNYYIDFLNQ